jgi:hydroxyethylthiazole kinase-like uncharacterized protein yjeF
LEKPLSGENRMILVSVEQMQNLEKEAAQNGLGFQKMMENAGEGLAQEIRQIAYSHNIGSARILGLVGPGKNGGDTLIAMRLLAEQGFLITVYLIKRAVIDDPLTEQLIKSGGKVINGEGDGKYKNLHEIINTCDMVIDGVLGTGFKLPMKSEIGLILEKIKNYLNSMEFQPIIVAVDCPSGVDNNTGAIADESFAADYTICMAAIKQGLLKLPAFTLIGKIKAVEIGFNKKNSSISSIKNQVADYPVINSMMIPRSLDAHKGTFGTALIVAGSLNYTGSALLAGKAAYKVGAGLVTMGVPAPLHSSLAGHFPEATWLLLPHEMGVLSGSASSVMMKNMGKVTALLVGCGLGTEETTYEFVEKIVSVKLNSRNKTSRIGFIQSMDKNTEIQNNRIPPLVLDADGLKLLARIPSWTEKLPQNSILTPHPGEMEILTGVPKDKIQENRLSVASHFAKEWKQIVVLKGAFTVIAAPDGSTTTIPVATPALARAGSGDVLAGMIVGLLAQGMTAYSAAITGAWLHAQTGLLAAERLGGTTSVVAGDLLEEISNAIAISDYLS